ncbi:MAG: aminotransferase class IV [Microcystaceae cyanobacterium]
MYWFDGKWWEGDYITLPVADPGLIYGATVFTTLRVYQQSLDHPLTHWQDHCDRLQKSVEQLQWPHPHWEVITEVCGELLKSYPVLRIVLFADGKIWITGRNLPENLGLNQQQGIVGWLADQPMFKRAIAPLKTGNYLTAWLANQEAQKQGAKEAILINSWGHWLETSTGNLWGFGQGIFYTPPEDQQILPGIMRSRLLSYLKSSNIQVEELEWSPDLVKQLEMIAYSNSVVEIMPFAEIITSTKNLKYQIDHPALAQLRKYCQ